MATRFISFVAPRATRSSIDLDSPTPYIDDSMYLGSNNVDPDFDIDGGLEFDDSDGSDDLAGLTIVEPNGVLETVRFLNGYAVE